MEISSSKVAIRRIAITLENGETEEKVPGLTFFDSRGRVQLVIPEWNASGLEHLASGDTVVLTIRMD